MNDLIDYRSTIYAIGHEQPKAMKNRTQQTGQNQANTTIQTPLAGQPA